MNAVFINRNHLRVFWKDDNFSLVYYQQCSQWLAYSRVPSKNRSRIEVINYLRLRKCLSVGSMKRFSKHFISQRYHLMLLRIIIFDR